MVSKDLKNKPLVEALIEIRWALQPQEGGYEADPHYRLLPGRFYDKIKESYPVHEPLASAQLPDQISQYKVQHRFRAAENDWPLIQIGPGIFTFNETSKYLWDDFKTRAVEAVTTLFQVHSAEIKFTSILLRYIDAVDFDYLSHDILIYIKDMFKINIVYPENLFEDFSVKQSPNKFNLQSSFYYDQLASDISIRLATGTRESRSAIIWETIVQSVDNTPTNLTGVEQWISKAHDLTHDWFFKLIEGDLERSFDGE
jgi:uncharacterized protein (TIGR04255 family)